MTCNWFVIINTPVINKSDPPILLIIVIFCLRFFETSINFWIKYPETINGKAKPME